MGTPIAEGTELDRDLEEVLDEFSDVSESVEAEEETEAPPAEDIGEASSSSTQNTERTTPPLRLLPTQLTANRMIKGRPRKIEKAPNLKDLNYHAQVSAEKSKFIDEDRVVTAARNRAEAAHMLQLIKEQIAAEAAAIHFQRIENEKLGKDTAQTSTRRIDALTKIANIELEIKKLGADLIDLRGERFQRVFKLWIAIIREVAADTLPPEQIDLFFNRLSTAMEGWEDKAMDNVR